MPQEEREPPSARVALHLKPMGARAIGRFKTRRILNISLEINPTYH